MIYKEEYFPGSIPTRIGVFNAGWATAYIMRENNLKLAAGEAFAWLRHHPELCDKYEVMMLEKYGTTSLKRAIEKDREMLMADCESMLKQLNNNLDA